MGQLPGVNSQVETTTDLAIVQPESNSLDVAQQLQYGGIAIAAIVAVTLLIRALTELVKAIK